VVPLLALGLVLLAGLLALAAILRRDRDLVVDPVGVHLNRT